MPYHHNGDNGGNGIMNHQAHDNSMKYESGNNCSNYNNMTHSIVSPKQKQQQQQRRRSSTHSISSIAQMTMDAMSCGMQTEATMTVSTTTSPSTATSGSTSPNPPTTTTTSMALQDVPEDVVVIDKSNHYTPQQQQQHRSTSSSSLRRSVPPPTNQRTESISLMSLGNPSNHQQHPHQTSLAASSLSFRFGKNNSSSHHTQSNNSSLGSNRMMFTLNESYTSFAQPPPPPFYQSHQLHDDDTNPSNHLTGTEIKNRRPSIFTSYSGKNYFIDDTTNGEPIPMMGQQQSIVSQQQFPSQQLLPSHSANYNRIETNSIAYPTDNSTIDHLQALRSANSSRHRHPQQSQNVIRSIGYHGGRDNSNVDRHMINVPRGNFSSECDDSRDTDLSRHYQHQQHHQRMKNISGEGNHQAAVPPQLHQLHHHQHQVERIKVLLSVENLDRIPPPLPHLPLCAGMDMNTRKQQQYVDCVSILSKRCLNSNNNNRLHSSTINGIPVGISVSTTNLSSGFETKRYHCYVMDCPRCYHKMMVSKYCTTIQCPECSTSHPAQESKEKEPLNA